MSEWTFITKHALVLSIISKHPRITALEMSRIVGITDRAIRHIISDLSDAGYIIKKREGRRVKYRINGNLSLRHQNHQDVAVHDFLVLLGWKGRGRQNGSMESVKS
jgi:DNA-binding transcriptional ArsR family regulator